LETFKKTISIAEIDPVALFGRNDENLDSIERNCRVAIVARGSNLFLKGDRTSVEHASGLLDHVVASLKSNPELTAHEIKGILTQDLIDPGHYPPIPGVDNPVVIKTYKSTVAARTVGQASYLNSIKHNDVVFAIGPAGTGKTYLAVAAAVSALREKRVSRIVLARPAVEAGESLGFLPGALEEKVDPYLRPLYDALQELLEPERLVRFQSMKIVEVAPLAFMRGRTLNDAFIILDEAQNTTATQMKMFLTRTGAHSKVVITGDITQIDLPNSQVSGLIEARQLLPEVNGLAFVHLNEHDVVRNPLVQRIIQAYEKYDNDTSKSSSPKN
tara:strand:+ start:1412 stop:2398 length:987 start_codon:yes stop_codon:yes gene_type:complete